jgi:F-type H+-transporting ATPase subunit gamma
MTERLSDISARIDGMRQLGEVVNAMRGIAAARAQQARGQLVAVESYAATIARAIGQTLALVPAARSGAVGRSTRPALVLFCAEQGFAGAFSERVLDAIGAYQTGSELFLIGTRGNAVAAERGIHADWSSPMPSHSLASPNSPTRSPKLSTPASPPERSTGSAPSLANGGLVAVSKSTAVGCFRLICRTFPTRKA